ncbi:serine/threonine protein kinase [Micromonospora orduensis]|uniref:Serine/threonine protein kinase n=1 Tax=Micromonospora orduensis TaxID=1420891 RepID=A0A5C4QX07_9ACTN|nr:serine/threonine protein kinase [Micromonospora orduensis]TNH30588.1 serine/threonine protein kinase [Micromonospora orduensis]
MTAVSVSAGWTGTDERWSALPPNGNIVFGSDENVADLVIPDEHAAGVVGRVIAADGHWTIQNATAQTPMLVENVAGNDFVSVPAGMEMPVPFTSARVLVFGSTGILAFSVQAAGHPPRVPARPTADGGTSPLNHGAKYFGVLVALCEPALRYGPMSTLPTSAEIAQRLRRLPAYRSITSAAVDFHLNYLCTRKLRGFVDAYSSIVGAPAPVVAHSRRNALVQLALRFNLVRRQHLRMLEGGARQPIAPPQAPRRLARRPAPRPQG